VSDRRLAEGGAGSERHLFLGIHTHVPAQERAVAAHCKEHGAHVERWKSTRGEEKGFRTRALSRFMHIHDTHTCAETAMSVSLFGAHG
jgi:hypothetical protein